MTPEPIRPFEPVDAEACARIVRACIGCDPSMPADLKEHLLRTESAALMCERAKLFYVAVCLLNGRPVALGGLDMNEIRILFVDPAHQRAGIGGTMLEHLEALVPAGLFSDIFVYAVPGTAAFYRARGYQAGGEHAFRSGGHAINTIFMTKAIG